MKKVSSSIDTWEEWTHARDEARAECEAAGSEVHNAREAHEAAGNGCSFGFRDLSGQLAHIHGRGFYLENYGDQEQQQAYLEKLRQGLISLRQRRGREAWEHDVETVIGKLQDCLDKRQMAADALALAEEALQDAEEHLESIEAARPPITKTTLADLDKQVSAAESESERITTSSSRIREELKSITTAIEANDLPGLAVDVELAADDERKATQSALDAAQKRHDTLQADLARNEALLEGLQRRAAAADERASELRALRREVGFESLYPELLAAQQKLMTVVNGPLNDAMAELFRLSAAVDAVAPDGEEYAAGRLELKFPHLHGGAPESGERVELPRRTEPRILA